MVSDESRCEMIDDRLVTWVEKEILCLKRIMDPIEEIALFSFIDVSQFVSIGEQVGLSERTMMNVCNILPIWGLSQEKT